MYHTTLRVGTDLPTDLVVAKLETGSSALLLGAINPPPGASQHTPMSSPVVLTKLGLFWLSTP